MHHQIAFFGRRSLISLIASFVSLDLRLTAAAGVYISDAPRFEFYEHRSVGHSRSAFSTTRDFYLAERLVNELLFLFLIPYEVW